MMTEGQMATSVQALPVAISQAFFSARVFDLHMQYCSHLQRPTSLDGMLLCDAAGVSKPQTCFSKIQSFQFLQLGSCVCLFFF